MKNQNGLLTIMKSSIKDQLDEIIQDCEEICYGMFHKILIKDDIHLRREQMKILLDCAEICTSTSILLAHNSVMLEDQLRHCYKVCMLCAEECSKFDDIDSQKCARVCYHCARACKNFITRYYS